MVYVATQQLVVSREEKAETIRSLKEAGATKIKTRRRRNRRMGRNGMPRTRGRETVTVRYRVATVTGDHPPKKPQRKKR